jgi:protein-S-isoprenylcysteine O-methyltransferase Ste14
VLERSNGECLTMEELEYQGAARTLRPDKHSMRIFFLLGLLLYGGGRLIEAFRQPEKLEGRVIAGYTLYLLVIGHTIVFFLPSHHVLNDALGVTMINLAGIFFVLLAVIGRGYSIRTLGQYHSIQIEIRYNHSLISSGPYHFIRNPYYLSNAVEVIGVPLAVGSVLAAAVALLIYWPCLYLRIIVEERALLKGLGRTFAEYTRRVPRLFPRRFWRGARI